MDMEGLPWVTGGWHGHPEIKVMALTEDKVLNSAMPNGQGCQIENLSQRITDLGVVEMRINYKPTN